MASCIELEGFHNINYNNINRIAMILEEFF